MLGTLQQDQKADWKIHIGSLVHAYNATKHETTGFSPFFLMFSREPTLYKTKMREVDAYLNRQQFTEKARTGLYIGKYSLES